MIGKDELIKRFDDYVHYFKAYCSSDAEDHEMLKAVLFLLKEQKNGEWIDHTFAHGDDIECPFCHKKWNVIDNCTETFDYCPGCGAKLS